MVAWNGGVPQKMSTNLNYAWKQNGGGVTQLYDGLTYLQNNKVDFRFYKLLKDLFKYYYVEADI